MLLKGEEFQNITRARDYSNRKLEALSKELHHFEQDGIAVVVNGSFARLEASGESDIDYFVLAPSDMAKANADKLSRKVRTRIGKVVERPPSEDGAFAKIEKLGSFGRTIGGQTDDNETITRRILFLTEGRAVTGIRTFNAERDNVLRQYVRQSISDHQLGQFLLNDIIRFYRTMCVDFENKTVQGDKPWGIRNIKLIFSRKMLYFGGVLICAEMAQRTYSEKISIAKALMAKSPVERVIDVCGVSAEKPLREYDHFLGEMAKESVRRHLDRVPEDRGKHTERFKSLKNRGHKFTMCLISALKTTYPEAHPIHRSLVM